MSTTKEHIAVTDVPKHPGAKCIGLSGGKTAHIFPGTGKHVRLANKIMEGDASMFMPALIHLLVLVDDQTLTLEEIDAMPMSDYLKVVAEMNGENFT